MHRIQGKYLQGNYNVTAFRYLGRVMTAGDDDCPTVVENLQRERKSWGWSSRILIREGEDPKVSEHFSRP